MGNKRDSPFNTVKQTSHLLHETPHSIKESGSSKERKNKRYSPFNTRVWVSENQERKKE